MPSTRIVKLPFAYEAEIIPPKKRNAEHYLLRAETLVPLPVVTSAEAPEAFRWIQRRKGETHELLLRTFDGRLYREMKDLPAEDFVAQVCQRRGWFIHPLGREGPWFSESDYPTLPAMQRRSYGDRAPQKQPVMDDVLREHGGRVRLKSENRAEQEIEAQAVLSRSLLFVDDGVWTVQTVWEPHWHVARTADGKVELEVGYGQDHLPYVHDFRADDLAGAEAFASALAAHWKTEILRTEDELAVLEPSAVRRDPELEFAEQIRSGLGRWAPEGASAQLQSLAVAAAEPIVDRQGAARLLRAVLDLHELPESRRGAMENSAAAGTAAALLRWNLTERARRPELAAAVEATKTDDEALAGLTA